MYNDDRPDTTKNGEALFSYNNSSSILQLTINKCHFLVAGLPKITWQLHVHIRVYRDYWVLQVTVNHNWASTRENLYSGAAQTVCMLSLI